jgi:hypothetical protein
MPFVIGDYEKQLYKMGHMVAVIGGKKFRCWQCEKGELHLTRKLNAKGELSPAVFKCDSCDDEIGIYPDKGGGVQPALKMSMRGKGFSADEPGSGGGWR